MTEYRVYEEGGSYYVEGLYDTAPGWADEDLMLLAVYPAGDCDRPYNARLMHQALYDLYQVCDDLHHGDTFVTPFGNFRCDGVHVVTECTERSST